jgi:hypothetical protein
MSPGPNFEGQANILAKNVVPTNAGRNILPRPHLKQEDNPNYVIAISDQ